MSKRTPTGAMHSAVELREQIAAVTNRKSELASSAGSVLCVVKITGPSLNIEMRIDSHRANLLMRAALDAALAEANINYREQTPNR